MAGRGGPGHVLAMAREQFLTTGHDSTGVVRNEIVASWRRSNRFWNLDAGHIEPPYQPDVDTEGPLVHAAAPILEQLHDEVDGAEMTAVLTDSAGYVLRRVAGGKSLNAHLDSVHLAPGFCYAEEHVGTNGIGVALENRKAARVVGHEHYADGLETLSCAAMPIKNPLTGVVEGVINLTSFDDASGALMVSVVQAAARDIEHRLLEQAGKGEHVLLTEFLAASAHSRGAVIAATRDFMMANEVAQRLHPDDLALLRQAVIDVLGETNETVVDLNLSDSQMMRVRVRPVLIGARSAGAVADAVGQRRRGGVRGDIRRPPRALPSLVGTHPLWVETCRQVQDHCANRTPLLLIGEAGVGKRSLALAVREAERPATPVTLVDVDALDPVETGRQLDGPGREGTLVLCHLDRLTPTTFSQVERLLTHWSSSTRAPWIVATVGGTVHGEAPYLDLLHYFAASVTVPPLRLRKTDIPDIATYLLRRRAAQRQPLEYRADVLTTLLRYQWPGNVAELDRVLQMARSRRLVGPIRPEDLPGELHMKEPRTLTTLEKLERDAIVQALRESDDNRVVAARSLGISRATLYRKMTAYGIESNQTT